MKNVSQQQGEQQGQQPDGAGQQQQQQGDLIPRAEAQKAFAQRDEAKQRARELEEQNRQLQEQLKQGQGQGGQQKPKDGGDEPPAWAQALIRETQDLRARLDGEAKAKQRGSMLDNVLSQLPEGNRKLARSVILGMEAEGALKLDDPNTTVDAAVNALKSSHGTLFVPAGSSASAIQVGPDGKIDWSQVKSASEVPTGAWKDMPDEVYERLTNGTGTSGALQIRGGR